MKYLPLYYKWMRTGEISGDGLCDCELGELFNLLRPTDHDMAIIRRKGLCDTFWASDLPCCGPFKFSEESDFTPLRQNIVLLMAAMSGEL